MAGERNVRVRFGGDASGVRRAAQQGERAVESFTSKAARIGRAVGAVVAMGTAMAATAAHAVALGSSAVTASGAVLLLPAALAAVTVAAVAARVVGMGLGEAWKATGQKVAAGGGAAASTAKQVAAAQRQVRDATRGLTDAQRQALTAQEAVTRARADEAERLADLTRSLTGARLDEEAAAQSLARAERELAEARRSGTPQDIAAADLAYRQAAHSLGEVRDRVADLAAEQAEGARKGVEGSDAVQAALKRQAEAQQAVIEADERLVEAKQAVREAARSAAAGGIDPATEALGRLAPAARAVILTLRQLAPAWTGAARAAQQATFRGVAGDLRGLSAQYLPLTARWLVRMGAAFNTAMRQTAALARTAGFVRDIGTVTSSTATATERLAAAVRPVVSGLMQFVAVGVSFLPGIAANAGTLAARFERWAVAARESGRMQQWIGDGLSTLRQFAALARNVVMTVVALVRAGDDGGATLSTLERGSAAMRAWAESAQGQEQVAAALGRARDILASLGQVLPVVAGHTDAFTDTLSVTGTVMQFLADHTDTLAKALPWLAAGFIVAKVAQLGANVAAAASIPIQIAQLVINRRLAAAITAQTAVLTVNRGAQLAGAAATGVATTATVAGDVAQKRSIVSLVASKVAMIATSAATKAWAAAQWLINVALTANPIGLVVLAIAALVAAIVIAYKKSDTFRAIVDAAFRAVGQAALWMWEHAIKPAWAGIQIAFQLAAAYVRWMWANVYQPVFRALAAVAIWVKDQVVRSFQGWMLALGLVRAAVAAAKDWIVARFQALVAFATSLPGRLKAGLSTIAAVITAPFRAAFNAIARLWNGTAGKLRFQVPGWVPGLGGKGFALPTLPQLQHGGAARAGRSYLVGERGPEVLNMGSQSGRVTPNHELGGDTHVTVYIGDRALDASVVRVVRERDRGLRRRVLAGTGTFA